MIRVRINFAQHIQWSNMTPMTHRQESLIRAKPGHRIHLALEKLKMTFSCRFPHEWVNNTSEGLEKQIVVATKQHRGVHKDTSHASPTSKYQFFERHWRQNHAHYFIIIKKDWQCKAGGGRLTPYQSEEPSPTLPTYRGKKEKGKIVEDKNGESN